MLNLLFVFAVAAIGAALTTPLARALAHRVGMVARPSSDRWHQRPTAMLGGVAIVCGTLAGIIATFARVFSGPAGASLPGAVVATIGENRSIVGVFVAAGMMFVAGLADDKLKLKPASKLVLQILSAAVLVSFDAIYPFTSSTLINVIGTMFWFLALTNALNLLDNMDGVAVGVAAIAATFLATTFALDGRWLLASLCIAVAGAAVGLLPFNFHPASIFMGDSGSLFLGALLAGMGALFPAKASGSIISVLFVPAMIVLIPILDTTLVTVARTVAGRPISAGGRDHTAHRLVAMGLSEKQTALLLYFFAAVGGGVALLLQRSGAEYGLWLGGLFLFVMLLSAAYLARLHTYRPDEVLPTNRVTILVSNLLYKRRALEVVMDLLIFAGAYYGAFLLRWESPLPPSQVDVLQRTLAIAIACKLFAFWSLGVYRGVWRHVSIPDLHRFAKAVLLAELLTIGAVVFFFRETEFSRSVFVLDALLAALLTMGARISFRSFQSMHRTLVASGEPTLIYGAGQAGELIVRELRGNPAFELTPAGFVDDDPRIKGALLHGLPVIGGVEDVPAALLQLGVRNVIVATSKVSTERVETLLRLCAERNIPVLRFELGLSVYKLDEGDYSNGGNGAPITASIHVVERHA